MLWPVVFRLRVKFDVIGNEKKCFCTRHTPNKSSKSKAFHVTTTYDLYLRFDFSNLTKPGLSVSYFTRIFIFCDFRVVSFEKRNKLNKVNFSLGKQC